MTNNDEGGRAGSEGNWLTPALIYGGAALLTAAMFQSKRSSRAEAEHPPIGRFIKVDDTTVHYADMGEGPPIVLLHGLGATLEDWFISGLVDALLPLHRVIVIDRPGYGYSKRPGGAWTPEREARLLANMLHRLGAHDAVVVGHSYGVLPAIAMALRHEGLARALVLVGGAYFPGATLAEVGHALPELPGVGGLVRATVTPSLARAALPSLIETMFEPQAVPQHFMQRFPMGLATRPGQLRSAADDSSSLRETLARLAPHYGRIACPVTVICGSGDAVVDPDTQSRAFAQTVPHARLIVVPAMGHMVHHSGAARLAAAILDTFTGEIAADDPGPPPNLAQAEAFPEPEAPAAAGAPAKPASAKEASAARADSQSERAGKGAADTSGKGGTGQQKRGASSRRRSARGSKRGPSGDGPKGQRKQS